MVLIHIDRNPARWQLNVFGLLWLIFFTGIGAVVLWRFELPVAAVVLWIVAVIVPAVGWAAPPVMRLVYLGMAYAAFPIGLVVSLLILLVVYYAVIAPIGLAMRLFGYDPMRRRSDRRATSYWVERENSGDIGRYFRQF
jgi:hypothetical protein